MLTSIPGLHYYNYNLDMDEQNTLSQMSLEELSNLVNAFYNNKKIEFNYNLILTELEYRRDQKYGN